MPNTDSQCIAKPVTEELCAADDETVQEKAQEKPGYPVPSAASSDGPNPAIEPQTAKTSKKRLFGTVRHDAKTHQFIIENIAPNTAIRLKTTFPRINKYLTGSFSFADTPEQATELNWFLQRFPMEMDKPTAKQLKKACETYIAQKDLAESILNGTYVPEAGHGTSKWKENKPAYPIQIQAAEIANAFGRLLVMDDLGLGKSCTSLKCIDLAQTFPAAIVVQSHLATQWEKEAIQEFTHYTSHIISSTTPYELPPAEIYIFKYSNIGGWIDFISTGFFKAAVYDEIQELRNGIGTGKGMAAQALSRHAKLKIGLSATPIHNYGNEVWQVMSFLDAEALGSYDDFCREWCEGYDKRGRIVKNPDALGQYLLDEYLAVCRQRQGRPINKIIQDIPYDEEIEKQEIDFLETLAIRVIQGNFVESGQAARDLDMQMRRITGIAKAKYAAAYARMILESGEPLIIAAWHRDVYRILLEELADFHPVMYTGSETTKQKDMAKAAFMSGQTDCFIISLRSGAGLDGLQKRCKTLMVAELDWSETIHTQLIGRIDRPGQPSEEVTAIYCCTDGGSDPLIVDILGIKASQSHGITRPFQTPRSNTSDDSRMKRLAAAVLDKKSRRETTTQTTPKAAC